MTTLSDDDLVLLLENTKHLSPLQQREVLRLIERRDKLVNIQSAHDNFLPFVEAVWPTFIFGHHHKIMAEAFDKVASGEITRLIINMAPRHRLDIDTPIPTTAGWKKVRDVKPGAFVFSPNGTPVRVTGASAVYDEIIYRVETSDGQVVECDGEHLWTVRFGSGRPYVTMATKDILAKCEDQSWARLGNMPMLPPVQPVQYPHRDLPIDPYVLGAWLGDGVSASGTMSAHPSDAPHIRARFEAAGVPTTTTKWDMTFGTRGLRVKLRAIGVLDDKHVPAEYLTAAVEQRLALLQGLMDTDGSVSAQGKCTYHGSNLRLMQDVLELVHSFGVKARIITRPPVQSFGGEYTTKQSYRISFKMAGAASLPRKAARCRSMSGNFSRSISITKTEVTRPVQCLEVANADGLFLAGRGYIVTHNTKSELTSWLLPAWFLGKYPHKKIIQASNTAELAAGFGRRVRNLVSGLGEETEEVGGVPMYQQIFPNVRLAADSQAAASWHTNKKGEYFAIGVNGKVTGKGADIFIIDDPHALEISTPIPTPKGFVALGDLRVGDEVYGPDGLPTKVTGKSEVMHDRELYAVTTDDRQTILCDGGHLWTYRSDTKLSAPMRTGTTRELAVWGKASKPCLPRHAPVQYPEASLPIEPYVLGAWLGDGTSSLGRMTAHPDDAPFMREQFEASGYRTTDLADRYSFGVMKLRAQLITSNLLNNKHIPDAYMTASVSQRMALLQGLMDTDGNVTEAGQCAFHNSNRGLVEATIQLLHSLGVKAKLSQYEDTRDRWGSAKAKYRVTFKLQDAARMPRKACRTFTPMDKRSRSIDVEPAGEAGTVQCITVDRADGLFLAGHGYVVTHNSEQEAKQAAFRPEVFDDVYEWYTSGPRQRLQPGAAIIIVMCMTGDTDVLMADGRTTKLRDIRPGDAVATYENGRIATSRIANWKSSGVDAVYTIQTQSGRIIRANERHPFLVDADGDQQWVRLRDLKPGMSLVAVTAATGPHDRKQSQGYAGLASQALATTEKTPTSCAAPQSTYSVTTDPIVSITLDGREEVFDVEVERTENFIANGVVSHNTRWSKRDLTGRVIQKQMARKRGEAGDNWTVIELPAIVDEGTERERSMWPAYWPLATLQATRGEIEVPKWKAQYQQEPTSEEGALIKRGDWQIWGANQPNTEAKPPSPGVAQAWYRDQVPLVKYIIQSWDTANTKTTRADFSACTTWGVFETEDPDTGDAVDNVLLLDAFKRRMEFPELKRAAKRAYIDYEPDTVLIEYKGSGIQLVQEFRLMKIPVQANNFGRGTARVANDKVARANLVSDIFASKRVWAPATRWADEVITECAEFPNGDFDDYVDSVVQAMLRLRIGGLLTTSSDVVDDDDDVDEPVRARAY